MAIEIKALTNTQMVLQLASKSQDDLAKTSVQIASGNKYMDFKGFAGDGNLEKFLSLKETVNKTSTYITSNTIVLARVESMAQTLEQLQGIASDVAQLIAQRRNAASGQDIPVDIQGAAILDDIAGKLNVKFDGRYLFSGTKTNTKPFPYPEATNVSDSGAATDSYYEGDSIPPSVKISDSQTLNYGVTGNEEAFQKLIGAVNLAMDGHSENDDTKLASAMDMINESVSALASVRANIASSKNTIVQANVVHSDISILIGDNLNKVSQTNIVEATTRMSELEATVQATYIAFTRLSGLRLSNFLN